MSSADRFFSDFAWPWIQAAEGVDSDAAADKGGRTRYGISQAAHPNVDVPRLTLAQARAIYYQEYWLAAGCDRLLPALAVAVFGGAVQHDPKDSVRFLQRRWACGWTGTWAPSPRPPPSAPPRVSCSASTLRFAPFITSSSPSTIPASASDHGWLYRLFRLQRFILEHCR